MVPKVKKSWKLELSAFFFLCATLMSGASEFESGEVVYWGTSNFAEAPESVLNAIDVAVGESSGYIALLEGGTLLGWGEGVGNIPNGISNVATISAGDSHALALLQDGSVVAWGSNNHGQATIPEGIDDVAAIAAGKFHSLALLNNGTVFAWGSNSSGQATPPEDLDNVAAIAAGGFHSLALLNNGTVVAWGSNDYDFGQALVPGDLSNVIDIAAGIFYSAALQGDGTLRVWGSPPFGIPDSIVIPNANKLIAGPYALAVITETGDLHRFGSTSSLPPALTKVSTLAIGTSRGIAVVGESQDTYSISVESTSGGIATVLPNRSSYLSEEVVQRIATPAPGYLFIEWTGSSTGNLQSHSIPVFEGFSVVAHFALIDIEADIVGWGSNNDFGKALPPAGLSADVVAIAAGMNHSLTLLSDGTVVGWGSDFYGESSPPEGLTGVAAIATGGDYRYNSHSLALLDNGTVVGWGADWYGQASPPDGLTDVIAIAAGAGFSLALRNDGFVVGWGDNEYDQASPPAGLADVIAISAGHTHSLALREDGTVVGWGWNPYGAASPPPGLSNVEAIAAGRNDSLALLSDGTVVQWGLNARAYSHVWTQLTDVIAISAGFNQSLALLNDGSVVSWPFRNSPQGLANVVAISAGYNHSLALRAQPLTALDVFLANKLADLPPAMRHWHVDANGNGLPNLIEYARGTDPSAANSSTVWPLLSSTTVGEGADISFVLRVNDPALKIICEVSSDLDTWIWILREDDVTGVWQVNPSHVTLIEWDDLGDGLRGALLRTHGEEERLFVRMRVEYASASQ